MNSAETGVEFNFSFAEGVTNEQILGFELAGEMWSQYLGDTHMKVDEGKDFTVNIHVEITNNLLPDNVLGGAFPAIETGKRYQDFYKAIIDDVSTQNDRIVADNLLNRDKVDILVGDRIVGDNHIQLTRANLKALNLIAADDTTLDGYIVINDLSNINSVQWNYDYLGGAKAGTIDFLSTATHEIGHVLGFISGTDRPLLPTKIVQEYATSSNNIIQKAISIKNTGGYYVEFNNGLDTTEAPNNDGNWVEFKGYYQQQDLERVTDALQTLETLDDYNSRDRAAQALNTINDFLKRDNNLERVIRNDVDFQSVLNDLYKVQDSQSYSKFMTTMDLFRYSVESASLGINDLSVGNAAYFSLDGSQTDLALSKGTIYDYQGSHWENRGLNDGLGVMNPTIAINEQWTISQNDLLVMDAIGWDVVFPGELDLETLYNAAQLQTQTASIENRSNDVEQLLSGEAYNWGRRSSTSSSSRFWQEGYFSTFDLATQVITTENSTDDRSSVQLETQAEDRADENNVFFSENTETIFSTTKSDRTTEFLKDRQSQDKVNQAVSHPNDADNVFALSQNNNRDRIHHKRNNQAQLLLDIPLVNPLVSQLGASLETLTY